MLFLPPQVDPLRTYPLAQSGNVFGAELLNPDKVKTEFV